MQARFLERRERHQRLMLLAPSKACSDLICVFGGKWSSWLDSTP